MSVSKLNHRHSRASILALALVIILNLNLIPNPSGQTQNELSNRIFCNDQWCEDAQVVCEDETARNCSKIGFRKMKSPERCNCCEYCFDYLEEKQDCASYSYTAPLHMCGPGLQCRKTSDEDNLPLEKCEELIRPVEMESCNKELREYNKNIAEGKLGVSQYKPECDAHGDYFPRQCLTGSICYCANEKGERIFGMGTVASLMNCACARDFDRITRSFGLDGSWPHCLPNGNYDELQCSKRTRTCYCISKPDTSVVPIQLWTKLPCYNPTLHGNYQLRPCEVALSRVKIQILETGLENKTLMYADHPRCGPDGNYESVQSVNTKWICVDSDNNQLVDDENDNSPFELEKSSLTPGLMNCNCARARYVISNSSNKPQCCSNGSYRKWQCTGSTCYCVNQHNGKQDMNFAEEHIDNVEKLSCHMDSCPSLELLPTPTLPETTTTEMP